MKYVFPNRNLMVMVSPEALEMWSTYSLPLFPGQLIPTVVHCRWLSSIGQIKISKVMTLLESDPKVPFSIATTPRCREEYHSIPWIAPLYPWSVPYNAECYARRNQALLSLWYDSTWDWTPVSLAIVKHPTH